ncbi:MAG TPA: hypothetical protein H9741_03760, partial [Candidatus Borkfalkia faecipullorum]|nr:hypothetical protein [Candidatus Borkfalkia faecipullorum]
DFRENPRARACAADRLFSLFARFLGLSYCRMRANSLFPRMPFGKSGEKGKNVVLPFSRDY